MTLPRAWPSLRAILERLYDRPNHVAVLASDAGVPLAWLPLNESAHVILQRVFELVESDAMRRAALLEAIGTGPYASIEDLKASLAELRAEILRPQAWPIPAGEDPFRGLRDYEEKHAGLFFGRNLEVQEALARLSRQGALLVTGVSGAGKSSLVKAGLVPWIHRNANEAGRAFQCVVLRPGEHPFSELRMALARRDDVEGERRDQWITTVEDKLKTDGNALPEVSALDELLVRWDDPVNKSTRVLVIDQLEEVETACKSSILRARFLEVLCHAATHARERTEGRVLVVMTVRLDFVGTLLQHEAFKAFYNGGATWTLGHLRPTAVDEVIRGPLGHASGVTVDQDFVDAIAHDLGTDPGALPLLSYLLDLVWQRRAETGGVFSLAAYRKVGPLAQAIGKLADTMWSKLTPEAQNGLNRVFLKLAGDVGGEERRFVRRRVTLAELAAAAEVSEPELTTSLHGFVDEARLIVSGQEPGDGNHRWLEVAHEAIFTGWEHLREMFKENVLALHHDIEAATVRWKKSGELWPDGVQLREAERLFRDRQSMLTRPQREFLRRSRARARLRRGVEITIGVVLALAAASLYVLYARAKESGRREETQREKAEQLVEFMLGSQEGKLREIGRLDVLEDSVEAVQRYYRELERAGLGNGPTALGGRAASLVQVALIRKNLGDLSGAMEAYRQSQRIYEGLVRREPKKATWQRGLSVIHNGIGDVLEAQGDLTGALGNYRVSLTIMEHLAQKDARNPQWLRDIAAVHDRLGDVLKAQRDLIAALGEYRNAVTIMEGLVYQNAHNPQWQRDLSISRRKIGDVLYMQGDLAGALNEYRASLAIRERLAQQNTRNAQWQRDLSVSHEKIGDVLRVQGDLEGARDECRASVTILERLVQQDARNVQWQTDLALSRGKLGGALASAGETAQAVTMIEQGLATLRALQQQQQLTAEQAQQWIPAFEQTLARLRGGAPALPASPRTGVATVTTGTGLPVLTPGAACRFVIQPPTAPQPMCTAMIVCGDQTLYGGGNTGVFPCTIAAPPARHVVGHDTATDDGDPAMEIDTRAGTLRVWDAARGARPAFRVEARITSFR